jgi:hypothetical protein
MAMTKAERAQMDALRVRCALGWPPNPPAPVDLQVAKAATGATWLRLWWVNRHTQTVGLGVTNATSLCSTSNPSDEALESRHAGRSHVTMSQGAGGPWYASELDALRALHHATALECAEKLARLSERVEAASEPPQKDNGQ